MSPSEPAAEPSRPASASAGVAAPFVVDPRTLAGLPLGQIIARVGMLEGALRESENRLRLLVDAVTEYAIFTLDPDGLIESWNTGAERMKGYSHDEALGLDFSMLFPQKDRVGDLPRQLLDRARAQGSHEHTGWLLKKDGSSLWSDVVISSMLDDRGRHTGFVMVMRDLTEQHRLEVAQDAFLNTFTHDVKMPITAIQGFAELLTDVGAQEQEHFVHRIESNTSRLLAMVEELIANATVTMRLPVAPDAAREQPSEPSQRPPLVRQRSRRAQVFTDARQSGAAGAGSARAGEVGPQSRGERDGDATARTAPERALAELLENSHEAPDHALPELFEQYGQALGVTRVVAYLADLQARSLAPLLGMGPHARDSHVEVLNVDRTMAGRAFQHLEVVRQVLEADESTDDGRLQVWLPLVDGTERVGVLAVTVPDADALEAHGGALEERLLTFAAVAAELIVTKTKYGDTLVRLRRTKDMSLAAEMQWSLLPPLAFVSDDVTITGGVEPAYEVGGDTFDYAVDPGLAHLAVFDAMGHGLPSAQLSALTVAAYRNARRGRLGLSELARSVDAAVASVFAADAFATGVVVKLDTETGMLQWVNAGHPAPLLLRHGRLVRTLDVEPTLPFGLGGMVDLRGVHIGQERLEPGDMVLLHSDGVVEARSPHGAFFGTDRLVELLTLHLAAGLPPTETMRRVTLALLDHHQGRLSDDASFLLLQYRPQPRPEHGTGRLSDEQPRSRAGRSR